MNATPSHWIRLQSERLTAQIDPQGAQLSVLRDRDGSDLLWNGDPAVWKGRAPILFPIVGTLQQGQYRWQGQRYALSRHGFARDRRFALVREDGREALFRLAADAETLRVYPFRFELDLLFRLDGATLAIEAVARNCGTEPMPASLGFHPALRWPLPTGATRAEHVIEFERDEPAPVRRLDARGLLTPASHPTPVQDRTLRLDDALFVDDVLIFDQLASRSLIYGPATGPRMKVSFPNATYLGLWTKPGAGFLCIEPWRGVADPGGFDGGFDAKPGVFHVAPGAEEALHMRLEWGPGR